jgi:hypothetical protein
VRAKARGGPRAIHRRRHDAERVEDHAEIEPREVKDFQNLGVTHELLQIGRGNIAGRNLHDVGRAVAGRQLHDAEPITPRVETHRLGVDRDRGTGVARQVGKIAVVLTDGHCQCVAFWWPPLSTRFSSR